MSHPAHDEHLLPGALLREAAPSEHVHTHEGRAVMVEDEKSSASTTSLLDALAPIRALFQLFLTDEEAGRLMRVGRSFVSAVLLGFRIRGHVFCAESPDHLRRLAVYERYGLLISCMQLAALFRDPLVDESGRSLLPSSLIALALGYQEPWSRDMFGWLVDDFFELERAEPKDSEEGRLAQLHELLEESDVPYDPDEIYEDESDAPSFLVFDPAYGVVEVFFDQSSVTSKDSKEQIVRQLHRLLEARIDALRDVEPGEEDASTRLVYQPAYGLYNCVPVAEGGRVSLWVLEFARAHQPPAKHSGGDRLVRH